MKLRNSNESQRPDIQTGVIAEDCSLHIGEVTHVDWIKDECIIKSMFDGVERHCSLRHCGVVVQTTEDVVKKTALYNKGGIDALVELYESTLQESRL